MAAWLLKTEPSSYSFADLVAAGTTRWDGIRNPRAIAYVRRAKPGDVAFVYHTGGEKAVVGTAEITSEAYPDPKEDGLWVVDLAAKKPVGRKVTLADIKADPLFAESPLVRQGRLSFVPLTDEQRAWIEARTR